MGYQRLLKALGRSTVCICVQLDVVIERGPVGSVFCRPQRTVSVTTSLCVSSSMLVCSDLRERVMFIVVALAKSWRCRRQTPLHFGPPPQSIAPRIAQAATTSSRSQTLTLSLPFLRRREQLITQLNLHHGRGADRYNNLLSPPPASPPLTAPCSPRWRHRLPQGWVCRPGIYLPQCAALRPPRRPQSDRFAQS